jgi:hypothetical protein
MARLFLSAFLIVVVAAFAPAQSDSRASLYAGYSFFSNDFHITRNIGEASYFSNGRGNLHGWNVSAEVKTFRWIGLVADFNGSYGSVPVVGISFSGLPPTINTHIHTYLFGPRFSVQVGRVRPFAEALVGAESQSLESDFDSLQGTGFASALGGGVDLHFTRRFSWRMEADYIPSRQFKDLQPSSIPVQRNFRFSTGMVFRF